MTPERFKEIDSVARQYSPDDPIDSNKLLWLVVDKRAGFYKAEEIELLTWGELRALLAAVGKTCEWVEAVGCYDTTCGHSESGAGWADFCPHGGGRVVVRGQKESK